MRSVVAIALCALVVLAGCGGGGGGNNDDDGGAGGGGGGGGGTPQPFGLDARVAPSGVQIPIDLVGGGGTTARAVVAFPNISTPGPTFMTGARDGSNRLFVTDRNGVIKVFDNRSDVSQSAVFMDLSSRVDDSTGENGMLALLFDPSFASNRYFYVSYVYVPDSSNPNPAARTVRVSRFTANAGGTAAEAASELVLFEYAHTAGYHFGGWIGFGPEAGGLTLYFSTGDGGQQPAVQNTSSVFGKVLRLRIKSDRSGYEVPSDNPFGSGNPVWALGFRNPWRCSFDRAGNGNLWCGDVGESSYEEVNLVKRGKNYGWPYYEGPQAFASGGGAYNSYEPAVHHYPHSVGAAVIGGYVYRGSAMPGLVGRYLYTDFVNSTLWSVQTDGSNEIAVDNFSSGRLIYAMGEDDAGEIYALNNTGTIYRFEATGGGGPTNPPMPATLSATGLFTNLAQLTPAPGMIDFEVNSPLWSDGALKRRWVIVPDGQTIGFSAAGAWTFPVGTITVKHFELPLAAGGTTRVETRVMVHRSNGWTGYTYRWRSDQQDADLLTVGGTATYQTVEPVSNTPTTLTWNFPSQAQCMNCHTAATGRVLGLNTRQFNGNHTYAATGRSDNQLRTLNHIGIFSSDIGAASQYTAMPDPKGSGGTLDARARAYLDTNCSICHRPGGPTPVNMDLRYATSLVDMNIVGVNAASGTPRVAAGNHAQSELWQRANSSNGSFRMPPLAVQMIDAEAVQLLSEWIDALQ